MEKNEKNNILDDVTLSVVSNEDYDVKTKTTMGRFENQKSFGSLLKSEQLIFNQYSKQETLVSRFRETLEHLSQLKKEYTKEKLSALDASFQDQEYIHQLQQSVSEVFSKGKLLQQENEQMRKDIQRLQRCFWEKDKEMIRLMKREEIAKRKLRKRIKMMQKVEEKRENIMKLIFSLCPELKVCDFEKVYKQVVALYHMNNLEIQPKQIIYGKRDSLVGLSETENELSLGIIEDSHAIMTIRKQLFEDRLLIERLIKNCNYNIDQVEEEYVKTVDADFTESEKVPDFNEIKIDLHSNHDFNESKELKEILQQPQVNGEIFMDSMTKYLETLKYRSEELTQYGNPTTNAKNAMNQMHRMYVILAPVILSRHPKYMKEKKRLRRLLKETFESVQVIKDEVKRYINDFKSLIKSQGKHFWKVMDKHRINLKRAKKKVEKLKETLRRTEDEMEIQMQSKEKNLSAPKHSKLQIIAQRKPIEENSPKQSKNPQRQNILKRPVSGLSRPGQIQTRLIPKRPQSALSHPKNDIFDKLHRRPHSAMHRKSYRDLCTSKSSLYTHAGRKNIAKTKSVDDWFVFDEKNTRRILRPNSAGFK